MSDPIDEAVAAFRDTLEHTMIVEPGAIERDSEELYQAAVNHGLEADAHMREWAAKQASVQYVMHVFRGAILLYVNGFVFKDPTGLAELVLKKMLEAYRTVGNAAVEAGAHA